jgi:alpha-L-fucosidase
VIDLRVDIARGQSVSKYVVEGKVGGVWRTLATGTTVGYRKLDRIAPVEISEARVAIESVDGRGQVRMKLYGAA